MTPIRSVVAAALLAALPCMTPLAFAQSAPAKPAAAPPQIVMPPAKAAPKTLGGKAPVGKLLSREELRSCMKRLEDVNASGKDNEQRRAALDKEKDDLVTSGDALKADRAAVDTKLAAVREWEGRMRAHGAEIEAFNKRLTQAQAAPPERREDLIKELEAERDRLNKARVPLTDEEARLVPAYQAAVAGYNEKAKARDAKVEEWNTRNKSINELGLKHEEERSLWLSECANRPYREDDEIAIKNGK
jgi:DNA repair exonuclease SbcCD ATPase subunit